MTAPTVDWIDLNQKEGSLVKFVVTSEELEIEREAKMANLFRTIHIIIVCDQLLGRLWNLSNRFPIKS